MSQKNLFVRKIANWAGAEGQNSNIMTQYFFAIFTMFASKNGEMGLFRQCFKAEVKFLTQK